MHLAIHSKPKSFSTPVRSLQKKLTQLGNRVAPKVVPVTGRKTFPIGVRNNQSPHLPLRLKNQIFPSCWITRGGKKLK